MTNAGISMTEKGIPEKKHFHSLLDDYHSDSNGYVADLEAHEAAFPQFKEIEGVGMDGHEFISEKIYYCYCRKTDHLEEIIHIHSRDEYVQLYLGLQGKMRILDEQKNHFEILPQTVQLVKYLNGEVTVCPIGNTDVEVLVINIHKSLINPARRYFQNLIPFIHSEDNLPFRTFSPQPLPIGPQMRQIAEELAQKRYSGCFMEHFEEIKVLELLLLFIHEWTLYEQKETLVRTSPLVDDKIGQQMEQVREVLLASIAETPTLKELATAVGTNEFHLKQHFKSYFGKTVMAYLRDHKMEIAKKQLLETERKIIDIAESLGYKHATHFSAAFKKHYGKLPKDFR